MLLLKTLGNVERRSTDNGSCLQGSVCDESAGSKDEVDRDIPGDGGIAETARRWHTSRNLVRKWVQRYHRDGAAGLEDRSRRPHHCPTQTPAEIEANVVQAKERTGYGRKRPAWYLWREEGLTLSSHTIRLCRNGFRGRKKKRKTFYPAHWAWEEGRARLRAYGIEDELAWQTNWGE